MLYINDIEHVSDVIKPILFADDTSLFHSHTCFNTVIQEATNANRTETPLSVYIGLYVHSRYAASEFIPHNWAVMHMKEENIIL